MLQWQFACAIRRRSLPGVGEIRAYIYKAQPFRSVSLTTDLCQGLYQCQFAGGAPIGVRSVPVTKLANTHLGNLCREVLIASFDGYCIAEGLVDLEPERGLPAFLAPGSRSKRRALRASRTQCGLGDLIELALQKIPPGARDPAGPAAAVRDWPLAGVPAPGTCRIRCIAAMALRCISSPSIVPLSIFKLSVNHCSTALQSVSRLSSSLTSIVGAQLRRQVKAGPGFLHEFNRAEQRAQRIHRGEGICVTAISIRFEGSSSV